VFLVSGSNVSRVAILGAGVLFVGMNLSFGIIILALAGVGEPFSLLPSLFYGGIIMNFVGFGILSYSVLSKRYRSRKHPAAQ